jgi:S-adenosylmethionine/arginine decarboxylase-like enzyme
MNNITEKEYKKSEAWGMLTSIDLFGCDPQIMRDSEAVKKYVFELCKLIDMKRFGECTVVDFGEDEKVAGFSMVQLIETSCISGHFANSSDSIYIDIFSCKYYDPEKTAEFTRKFFKAKKAESTVLLRGKDFRKK